MMANRMCVLAVALAATACGGGATHELVLARQAYAQASKPGVPVAASPLLDAQVAVIASPSVQWTRWH